MSDEGDELPLPTGPRPDADYLWWMLTGMPKVGRTSVDIHVFDALRAEVNARAAELARLRALLGCADPVACASCGDVRERAEVVCGNCAHRVDGSDR